MTTRRRARESALQILYRYDLAASASGEALKAAPSALSEDLKRHFDHFQVPAQLREFTGELVAGTLQEIPTIDPVIEKHAANWKISRMAIIDRSLLRMAVYEMGHFPEIPVSVTLNEAIELGKQFGTADTASFVNGILDAIAAEMPAKPASN